MRANRKNTFDGQLAFEFENVTNELSNNRIGEQMIVLHDSSSSDLSHLQAIAKIEEGFGMFDYVRIDQSDAKSWIGQIVQPNRNVSTVGERLDPTILHGLELMQSHSDVQSIASVQVFDILVLGEYDGRQMTAPRLRPLPGAVVRRLASNDTINVIGLPSLGITKNTKDDIESNVIGTLLNADDVPLCISSHIFNYHIMVSGGTGSGKSNAAANLVLQAMRFKKCVLIHDAKPDYALFENRNTDPMVQSLWKRFEKYGIKPIEAQDVRKIGFNGTCDPAAVEEVVGFLASDFAPSSLAAFFFPNPSEQNQFEAFASAAETLRLRAAEKSDRNKNYSVEDILNLIKTRMPMTTQQAQSIRQEEQVHVEVGKAILRKVPSRKRGMPWLDSVGQQVTNVEGRATDGEKHNRLRNSQRLDQGIESPKKVTKFQLEAHAETGRVIIIDYHRMDETSYALILSYFLRNAQDYRKARKKAGIVQLVDEAHRIFDNESQHSSRLGRAFERVMREGRSVDHSIILSLQNASQIPPRVMNNLNTKIVMRQNSKSEADAATQTMGRDFALQSMRLGTGEALVSMYESRAVVLARMAPSPFELLRNDNSGDGHSISEHAPKSSPEPQPLDDVDFDIPF